MYLSELKLWNFRKFGPGVKNDSLNLGSPDLTICFNAGLNVLIGGNDSGKTAIIDAIKLTLNTHSSEWIKVYPEDFHFDSDRLRIECLFENISDEEAKNFTEWLGMKDDTPFLRVILDVSKKNDKVLPYDIRAGLDENGSRLPAEAREYLKTTYLKPLRDAKSELMPKRNSRLSQILTGHTAFKEKGDDHWLMEVFEKFNTEIEEYFKEEKDGDSDGKALKEKLESYLESFFGENKSAVFSPIKKKLKELLEILKLSLEEDNLGLGSHNLLFIAAEMLNLERDSWQGLRLGLIEEVEAHLHPQTQLKVIEYLQELTERETEKVQLILTTHSPNIGSKVRLKNLIICCKESSYSMAPTYTKLAENDYVFLEKFLDVTKSNLLFAKGIILVEGWAEEIILPTLAKKIGYDLTKKGISVVNVASTAFLRYSRIFLRQDGKRMKIPVAIVTDLDIKPEEESETEGISRGDSLTKKDSKIRTLTEKFSIDDVKVFISPHWTLEYCLLKSDSLKSIFTQSVKEIHPDFDLANPEVGLTEKLKKHSLKKTEVAYNVAEKLKHSDVDLIELHSDEEIKYLVDAIKYAAGD